MLCSQCGARKANAKVDKVNQPLDLFNYELTPAKKQ